MAADSSNKNITELRILIALVIIFLGYLSVKFVILPLNENIEDSQRKISVIEKKYKKQFDLVRKKRDIDRLYETYSVQFKQNASDEQQVASIISEIEGLANDVQLRVSDIKPQKAKRVEFYNKFIVSLSIEGELKTLLKFLYQLQTQPHIFQIDELYIEKGALRGTQIKCRLNLSKSLIPSG